MLPVTFLSRCPSRARHFDPHGAHPSRRAGGSTGVTPRASATRLRLRATPSAASPRAVARAPAGSHGRGGGHHPNSGDPTGQEGQPETEQKSEPPEGACPDEPATASCEEHADEEERSALIRVRIHPPESLGG